MGKQDQQNARNTINNQGSQAWNNTENNRNRINDQNGTFWNNYVGAVDEDRNTRQGIQNNYNQALEGIRGDRAGIGNRFNQEREGYSDFASGKVGGAVGANNANIDEAISGYRNFANTGGFSTGDIQDLRARAVSPTRAIYANAQSNIDRQRSLQGGYSPNYTAASSKLARDESSQISDANVNANASIARDIQQGKLSGLTGMATTELGRGSQNLQASQINNQARLGGLEGMTGIDRSILEGEFANRGQELGAIGGMRDLYGTAPGLSGKYGDQALNSSAQTTNAQNSQNQLALGLIKAWQEQGGGSIWDKVMQGLGLAGGALPGIGKFFPGGGSPDSKPATPGGAGSTVLEPNFPDNPSGGATPNPPEGRYPDPVPNPYPPGDPNGPVGPPMPGPFSVGQGNPPIVKNGITGAGGGFLDPNRYNQNAHQFDYGRYGGTTIGRPPGSFLDPSRYDRNGGSSDLQYDPSKFGYDPTGRIRY